MKDSEQGILGYKNSTRILLECIKTEGEISIDQLLDVVEKEQLRFGPEETVIDVLIEKEKQGRLVYDSTTKKYSTAVPRKPPLY